MNFLRLRLVLTGLWVFTLGFSSSAYCQSSGIAADFVMAQSIQRPDGTQAETSSVGEYVLDSEGRMRLKINGIEFISDPVAGRLWKVDIAQGIATQSSTATEDSSGEGTATSGESWKSDFTLPQGNWPAVPEPTVEELADRTVNGLECNGRLSQISLPAGTIGNADSIVIETETWTSDTFGFKIPVMVTIRSDTIGFTRRELRNVTTSDFSATHFRPDARYTIVERDRGTRQTATTVP